MDLWKHFDYRDFVSCLARMFGEVSNGDRQKWYLSPRVAKYKGPNPSVIQLRVTNFSNVVKKSNSSLSSFDSEALHFYFMATNLPIHVSIHSTDTVNNFHVTFNDKANKEAFAAATGLSWCHERPLVLIKDRIEWDESAWASVDRYARFLDKHHQLPAREFVVEFVKIMNALSEQRSLVGKGFLMKQRNEHHDSKPSKPPRPHQPRTDPNLWNHLRHEEDEDEEFMVMEFGADNFSFPSLDMLMKQDAVMFGSLLGGGKEVRSRLEEMTRVCIEVFQQMARDPPLSTKQYLDDLRKKWMDVGEVEELLGSKFDVRKLVEVCSKRIIRNRDHPCKLMLCLMIMWTIVGLIKNTKNMGLMVDMFVQINNSKRDNTARIRAKLNQGPPSAGHLSCLLEGIEGIDLDRDHRSQKDYKTMLLLTLASRIGVVMWQPRCVWNVFSLRKAIDLLHKFVVICDRMGKGCDLRMEKIDKTMTKILTVFRSACSSDDVLVEMCMDAIAGTEACRLMYPFLWVLSFMVKEWMNADQVKALATKQCGAALDVDAPLDKIAARNRIASGLIGKMDDPKAASSLRRQIACGYMIQAKMDDRISHIQLSRMIICI